MIALGLYLGMLFGFRQYPKVLQMYGLEMAMAVLVTDERHIAAKVHYFVSDCYSIEYCIDGNCTHRHLKMTNLNTRIQQVAMTTVRSFG